MRAHEPSRPTTTLVALLLSGLVAGALTAPAHAADIGVLAKRLVVTETIAKNGKSRMIFLAKDPAITKGSSGNPTQLSGELHVFYTDTPSNASVIDLPSPWNKNDDKLAKFLNTSAPGGVSEARVAIVKPGKIGKVVAKAKGALDISGAPGAGGVTAVLVVNNGLDGSNTRMCVRFAAADGSTLIHRQIAGGLGNKLILKNGVGVACPDDCSDGFANGTETDVDCGGGACAACAPGQNCSIATDCDSLFCSGGICQMADCSDGIINQDETDVDCGGSTCGPCSDGDACLVAGDCTSNVCTGGICQTATCSDGVANQDETDIDCGGATCGACPNGSSCSVGGDCLSLVCSGNICQVAMCTDGILNQDETDIDCGGSVCTACGAGDSCLVNGDCDSNNCQGSVCQASTCSDGIQNQGESDVDCGGPNCAACGTGDSCGSASDCVSGVCTGNLCQAATCADGVLNQDETDVDCGGSTCGACSDGQSCSIAGDCTSLVCTGSVCQVPTCSDGVQNQGETDVDCGGPNCSGCGTGDGCNSASDCTSGVCSGNVCQAPTCADGVLNQNESDVDCGGVCGGCSLNEDCNGAADCLSNHCSGGVCRCASDVHTFSMNSNGGGAFDSAEWPGGSASHGFATGCSVNVNRPSGNIDIVGNLDNDWNVSSFSGFTNCFGSGGEDGDGCNVTSCPPLGIGSCESARPSCSAALNGSGSTTYRVQCVE